MEPVSFQRSELAALEQGLAWQQEGQRVVVATVAHTWGSSPRPAGALMVLSESGRFHGSVSGGCIEEELIDRVKTAFPSTFETIEYSSDTNRSLPCGGRLLLTLEPLHDIADLDGLLLALRGGSAVIRKLNLEHHTTTWLIAPPDSRTQLVDAELRVVYEPAWQLLVVGAGELAQWVCRFALLLDYSVVATDPRTDYRDAWGVPEVTMAAEYPDDFIAAFGCTERTAIVALTHDPKVDDMAIIEALNSAAFYVGALGSRRTTQARANRLLEHFDVAQQDVERIHGPIGIDLNSRRPQEIALAVMTDITAARNGVTISTVRTAP
mgnify:CR=1 FL=1|jgi:xanthine dehydrogenase accessory factor